MWGDKKIENKHTEEELKYFQSLPLDLKVRLTEDRIRAWVGKYGEDGVYVSFSGGKDSTVLLHIVRNLYPNVKAVFSNTGLEYPEIRQFATSFENVDMVYPESRFKDVITGYGYPLISKEVAEAIFYARKIGGGYTPTRNARTSELKRREVTGKRLQNKCVSSKETTSSRSLPRIKGDAAQTKRPQQQMANPMWYNFERGKRRRHELRGFKAGVVTQTETTFENLPTSQFNKEKYLPICKSLYPLSL